MDSDSGSDGEESSPEGGSDSLVLLLDVSKAAWETRDGGRPVDLALDCCIALLRRMMFGAPGRLVGVSLFGTVKDDGAGLANVLRLMPLREPSAADLAELLRIRARLDDAGQEWGAASHFSMADALWQASRAFAGCRRRLGAQTVALLSRPVEPSPPAAARSALKRAAELRDLGIRVTLFSLMDPPPEDGFFSELDQIFLNDLYSQREPPRPVTSVDEALPFLWRRARVPRASARIKFHLGPNVVTGIALYNPYRQRGEPKKVKLDGESNEEVEARQVFIGEEPSDDAPDADGPSGESKENEGDYEYQKWGGEDIGLTKDERRQILKACGSPGLRLLGFLPASSIEPTREYLRPCLFLRPDELSVEGSGKLLLVLRDRCLALGRVPVCHLISRWYSRPHLVALIPQKVDDGPNGFDVFYMPYNTDIRELTLEERIHVSDEKVSCAKNLIRRLKIKYSDETFTNPQLRTLYGAIEALALQEGDPPAVEDSTLPDLEDQDERLGTAADDFDMMFCPRGTKRSAEDDTGSGRSKSSASVDEQLLAARMAEGQLQKFTVAQLKDIVKFLRVSNLPAMTGIKKDRLVQIVYDNYKNI